MTPKRRADTEEGSRNDDSRNHNLNRDGSEIALSERFERGMGKGTS